MTAPTETTPAEAFDLLKKYVSPPVVLPVLLMDGSHCKGAWFRYEQVVPDQSVAFPHRRIDFRARVYVAITGQSQLTLHMDCDWISIFGRHVSCTEYVVTKTGNDVTIVPQWHQKVPTPTLDHIDIHTGGVSAEDYHYKVLASLKAQGGRISTMLAEQDTERTVPLSEFVALSAGLRNTMQML
jgi:hypothetical protein